MVPERAVTPKHIAKTIQEIVHSQKKFGKTVKEVYLNKQPIGQRHLAKLSRKSEKSILASRKDAVKKGIVLLIIIYRFWI